MTNNMPKYRYILGPIMILGVIIAASPLAWSQSKEVWDDLASRFQNTESEQEIVIPEEEVRAELLPLKSKDDDETTIEKTAFGPPPPPTEGKSLIWGYVCRDVEKDLFCYPPPDIFFSGVVVELRGDSGYYEAITGPPPPPGYPFFEFRDLDPGTYTLSFDIYREPNRSIIPPNHYVPTYIPYTITVLPDQMFKKDVGLLRGDFGSSDNQLVIQGSLGADKAGFNRTFNDGMPSDPLKPQPAEIFRMDPTHLLAIPPGMEKKIDVSWLMEVPTQ